MKINGKIMGSGIAALMAIPMLTNCMGVKFSTPDDNLRKNFSLHNKFNAIETNGTADIVYTDGQEVTLTISAPEYAFDFITVKIENGILKIGQDEELRKKKQTITGKYVITAYITAPDVTHFTTYGTGDIKSDYLSKDSIRLKTYGTGDIEIKKITCKYAGMKSYGTGDIEVGTLSCEYATATTSGTGDVEIKKINARSLVAETGGTGDITIFSGKIDNGEFSTSGTGDIEARRVEIIKSKSKGKNIKI